MRNENQFPLDSLVSEQHTGLFCSILTCLQIVRLGFSRNELHHLRPEVALVVHELPSTSAHWVELKPKNAITFVCLVPGGSSAWKEVQQRRQTDIVPYGAYK